MKEIEKIQFLEEEHVKTISLLNNPTHYLLKAFRVMREIAMKVYLETHPLENLDAKAIAEMQIDGEFEKRMQEGE